MKKVIIFIGVIGLAACSNRQEQQAQQQKIDSLNMEIARQRVIDSMNEVAAMQYELQQAEIQTVSTPARTASGKSSSSTTVYHNYGNAPANTTQQPAPTAAQKKKGWSNKATGAAIGAGAGAVTGALVSEKKGTGAIIGGVAGAALGLGTGAIIDNSQETREERLKRRQERREQRENN